MKSKKIIAGILAVTMMFGTAISGTNVLDKSIFGITASAETPTTVDVSTTTEFENAIKNNTNVIINVKADFSGYYIILFHSRNLTINLHGHTITGCISCYDGIPSTININGSGTIKGRNGTDTKPSGLEGIIIASASSLTAENVKFIGGNAIGENNRGGDGLGCIWSTATLKNCYVQGGSSTGTGAKAPAIYANGTTIYMQDCTLVKGIGGKDYNYIIVTGTTYDLDTGKEVQGNNITANTLVVGKGYTPILKDAEGSIDTPVTAQASIPAPTYTVTIPADVDFGSQKQVLEKYRNSDKDQYGLDVVVSKDFYVSASNVDNLFDDLGKKPQIDVKVTYNGFMTNGGETVPYQVKTHDDKAVASESVFCSFKNTADLKNGETNSAAGKILINRADVKKEGSYRGTMTFDISIPNAD